MQLQIDRERLHACTMKTKSTEIPGLQEIFIVFNYRSFNAQFKVSVYEKKLRVFPSAGQKLRVREGQEPGLLN